MHVRGGDAAGRYWKEKVKQLHKSPVGFLFEHTPIWNSPEATVMQYRSQCAYTII